MLGLVENEMLRLGMALIGSALISFLAYNVKALSISGAVAAFVMGVSFVFFGEPIWFTLLLTFFISASFWSTFKKHTKQKREAEKQYEKSGKRDAWQVFANGGIGMLLCIVSYFYYSELLLIVFVMVMAIVNADTWATEIGGLSRQQPRHIITGKKVEAGTSGGITILGTVAALAGAALIGIVAALFTQQWKYVLVAVLAGIVGCMLDSLLGATVQRMFKCKVCQKVTERSTHCNEQTTFISGVKWINNDVVNIASSFIGAGVGYVFYIFIV